MKCSLCLIASVSLVAWQGLEVIESTNLKYFTKEMTAEFYALKGMFLAQINKYVPLIGGHKVSLLGPIFQCFLLCSSSLLFFSWCFSSPLLSSPILPQAPCVLSLLPLSLYPFDLTPSH